MVDILKILINTTKSLNSLQIKEQKYFRNIHNRLTSFFTYPTISIAITALHIPIAFHATNSHATQGVSLCLTIPLHYKTPAKQSLLSTMLLWLSLTNFSGSMKRTSSLSLSGQPHGFRMLLLQLSFGQ
jgi:hypothetical protein